MLVSYMQKYEQGSIPVTQTMLSPISGILGAPLEQLRRAGREEGGRGRSKLRSLQLLITDIGS